MVVHVLFELEAKLVAAIVAIVIATFFAALADLLHTFVGLSTIGLVRSWRGAIH